MIRLSGIKIEFNGEIYYVTFVFFKDEERIAIDKEYTEEHDIDYYTNVALDMIEKGEV